MHRANVDNGTAGGTESNDEDSTDFKHEPSVHEDNTNVMNQPSIQTVQPTPISAVSQQRSQTTYQQQHSHIPTIPYDQSSSTLSSNGMPPTAQSAAPQSTLSAMTAPSAQSQEPIIDIISTSSSSTSNGHEQIQLSRSMTLSKCIKRMNRIPFSHSIMRPIIGFQLNSVDNVACVAAKNSLEFVGTKQRGHAWSAFLVRDAKRPVPVDMTEQQYLYVVLSSSLDPQATPSTAIKVSCLDYNARSQCCSALEEALSIMFWEQKLHNMVYSLQNVPGTDVDQLPRLSDFALFYFLVQNDGLGRLSLEGMNTETQCKHQLHQIKDSMPGLYLLGLQTLSLSLESGGDLSEIWETCPWNESGRKPMSVQLNSDHIASAQSSSQTSIMYNDQQHVMNPPNDVFMNMDPPPTVTSTQQHQWISSQPLAIPPLPPFPLLNLNLSPNDVQTAIQHIGAQQSRPADPPKPPKPTTAPRRSPLSAAPAVSSNAHRPRAGQDPISIKKFSVLIALVSCS